MVQQITPPSTSSNLNESINIGLCQQNCTDYDFSGVSVTNTFSSSPGVYNVSGQLKFKVLESLKEKAESLAAIQEKRIQYLLDVFVNERMKKQGNNNASFLMSLFSLYADKIIFMGEIMSRANMNKWQFYAYLDNHPEYQQVDIDQFLNNVKED